MKRRFQLFCLLVLIGMLPAYAQDPQLTQFYAAPLHLNPAFAGAFQGDTRGVLNSRLQWPALPKAFFTNMVSIDQNIEKFSSGIGLLASIDKSGTGNLTSKEIGFLYSYNIQFAKKWVARAGLHYALVRRHIDFYRLTFVDQLNLDNDFNPTEELYDNRLNATYFDFGSGLVLHNDVYYFGVAAHHLNSPNHALLDGSEAVVPMRFTVHGGAKMPLGGNTAYKNIKRTYVSPAFLYKAQDKFDQLDVGVYWEHDPLIFGIWYRGIPIIKSYKHYFNHDAFALLFGFVRDNLTFGYSYDFTISNLNLISTAGSHEISLSYIIDYGFNDNLKRRKRVTRQQKIIPCPKF